MVKKTPENTNANDDTAENANVYALILGVMLAVAYYFGLRDSYDSTTLLLLSTFLMGMMWFFIFQYSFKHQGKKKKK